MQPPQWPYHSWSGEQRARQIHGPGSFCKNATVDEIPGHDFILTPARYVGAEEQEDDGEPFDEKMKILIVMLRGSFRIPPSWKRLYVQI